MEDNVKDDVVNQITLLDEYLLNNLTFQDINISEYD